MIEKLVALVHQVRVLQTKLILIIGKDRSGKTAILNALARRNEDHIVSLGAELGRQLMVLPQRQRQLHAATMLRDLADGEATGDLLLLDNIELLFDHSLRLDPLDMLKRLAKSKCVVAAWPGELKGDIQSGRLIYADMGHPEYQEYGLAGVVLFVVQS